MDREHTKARDCHKENLWMEVSPAPAHKLIGSKIRLPGAEDGGLVSGCGLEVRPVRKIYCARGDGGPLRWLKSIC
jgi:hypothetical protein